MIFDDALPNSPEILEYHDMYKLLFAMFSAAAVDHSKYDCFLLAVMTHGDAGNVFFGIDGRHFTLAELMAPIKRCPTLAGKPKICIIQVSKPFDLSQRLQKSVVGVQYFFGMDFMATGNF